MNAWQKRYPPYEGEKPYLYFAFAQADSARVWKIVKILLERGCPVWYACGPAGSAQEVLRRQNKAAGARLTLLYMSDAAALDKDTKTMVLVNQKLERPLLCLDPDGADRRLSMGLREDLPQLSLQALRREEDLEAALIHADGFSQELFGEPVRVKSPSAFRTLSVLLAVLAAAALLFCLAEPRWLHWITPAPTEAAEDETDAPTAAPDEVLFSDPVIRAALRKAAGGGPITQELAASLTVLPLDALPESWDDLALLPVLETIELPQQALAGGGALPDGPYTIVLRSGAKGGRP